METEKTKMPAVAHFPFNQYGDKKQCKIKKKDLGRNNSAYCWCVETKTDATTWGSSISIHLLFKEGT